MQHPAGINNVSFLEWRNYESSSGPFSLKGHEMQQSSLVFWQKNANNQVKYLIFVPKSLK